MTFNDMFGEPKDPKSAKPLQLLFDGDMIVFQTSSASEVEIQWEKDFWTLHSDVAEVSVMIDVKVQRLTERVLQKLKYKGAYEIIMCFTDDSNFRKKLYPLYKANRIGKRKPVAYKGALEWVKTAYTTMIEEHLEADDLLGILATKPGSNTVIVSADKDFLSIPGYFYDMGKDVLHEVTLEDAENWHFYQMLVGDTADNYPGLPGCGDVGATKLLEGGGSWAKVVQAYGKKKLTEEDALLQARVSKILQWTDYNFETKEIKLWLPTL